MTCPAYPRTDEAGKESHSLNLHVEYAYNSGGRGALGGDSHLCANSEARRLRRHKTWSIYMTAWTYSLVIGVRFDRIKHLFGVREIHPTAR